MTLGAKLQNLRKQTGMSQETLAGQLGVSRQAVSRWELDISLPETENIIKLAKIFNVSFDYLLNEEITEISKSNDKKIEKSEKYNNVTLVTVCVLIAVAVAIAVLKFLPTMFILSAQFISAGFNTNLMSGAAVMALKFYTPIVAGMISILCLMIYIINKQKNK